MAPRGAIGGTLPRSSCGDGRARAGRDPPFRGDRPTAGRRHCVPKIRVRIPVVSTGLSTYGARPRARNRFGLPFAFGSSRSAKYRPGSPDPNAESRGFDSRGVPPGASSSVVRASADLERVRQSEEKRRDHGGGSSSTSPTVRESARRRTRPRPRHRTSRPMPASSHRPR